MVLYKGMILFHKKNRTKAEISEIFQKDIRIILKQEIAGKKELLLPITHIGEWLFFENKEIGYPVKLLASMEKYQRYRNENIMREMAKLKCEYKGLNMQEIQTTLKKEHFEALERGRKTEERKRKIQEKKFVEKAEIVDHLKRKHSFDGFHHYTHFDNFVKIMNEGKLYSRKRAEKIGFWDAAKNDIIKSTTERLKGFVRFYYKEKTPTMYVNEGIKGEDCDAHMPLPVLLLFSEEIIQNDSVEFIPGCGGRSTNIPIKDLDEVKKFDWEIIFSRGAYQDVFSQRKDIDDDYIKNCRNAEFIYPNEVDTKNIKEIIFRSPADMKNAIALLGENSKFRVDRKKFYNNNPYLLDYRVRKSRKNELEIYLEIWKKTKNIKFSEIRINDFVQTRKTLRYTKNREEKAGILDDIHKYWIKVGHTQGSIKSFEMDINGHLSVLWKENIGD